MKPPSGHSRRLLGLAIAAGLLATACGSSAPTLAPTPSPTPTPTPIPSLPPAAADLTVSGDPAVAGDLDGTLVRCNYPAVDGPTIVLAWRSKDGKLALRIVVSDELVTVRYSSGTGKTYFERDFKGTGPSGFHAANGAGIDSALEPVETGIDSGKLGPIVTIRGSVSCGDQRTGSSTVVLSGVTTPGKLTGLFLSPVRVECDATTNANAVQVVGVANVGQTPTLFEILADDNGFTLTQTPKGGKPITYVNKQLTTVRLAQLGAGIKGDAVEVLPAKSKLKAHRVTVVGTVVCGTVISNR